jgi:hypothetical protein
MSTVRELALKAALVKALADVVKEAGADVRKELQKGLTTAAEETGVRSLAVAVPGGPQVATISLSEKPETATITDPDAFTAWVLATAPEQVEEQIVRQVAPAFVQDLLAQVITTRSLSWKNPDTGAIEAVPGVAIIPAFTTHSVRLRKDAGPELLEAYRAGRLAGVSLPELLPTVPAVTS